MTRIHVLALALSLALSSGASAQLRLPKSPASAATSSADTLVGTLLVTPDADWRAKLEATSSPTPDIDVVSTVKKGQQVYILTFFSHSAVDRNGRANLTCDIEVVRPDGTLSTNQRGAACYLGPLKGGPENVHVSSAVIGFLAEAKDPSGTWVVNVSLKDTVANVVVPLTTTFTLE